MRESCNQPKKLPVPETDAEKKYLKKIEKSDKTPAELQFLEKWQELANMKSQEEQPVKTRNRLPTNDRNFLEAWREQLNAEPTLLIQVFTCSSTGRKGLRPFMPFHILTDIQIFVWGVLMFVCLGWMTAICTICGCAYLRRSKPHPRNPGSGF